MATHDESDGTGALARFAGWCYDRRRLVLAVWVVAVVAFGIAGQVAGGALLKTFDLPGSDAAKAFTILGRDFDRPGDTGQLVWRTDGGSPTDPAVRRVVQPVLDEPARQRTLIPPCGPRCTARRPSVHGTYTTEPRTAVPPKDDSHSARLLTWPPMPPRCPRRST